MADPEDTPTTTGPGARYTPAQPYTVHADAESSPRSSPGLSTEPTPGPSPAPEASSPRGRGPDPLTLLAGLAALLVAALAMTGLLVDTDPRWVLAGGAVLVGGLVLLTSLRRT